VPAVCRLIDVHRAVGYAAVPSILSGAWAEAKRSRWEGQVYRDTYTRARGGMKAGRETRKTAKRIVRGV